LTFGFFAAANLQETARRKVIALKRNGAYAENHPSAVAWIEASCLKVE
jgi:hypothetical protein